MRKTTLAAAALLLSAAGCTHVDRTLGGDPSLTVVPAAGLPLPPDHDIETYRIGAFDKLQIDVFGVEDLKREVQVDGGGKISFPLVGQVQAGGRTIDEVAETIQRGLKGRYVRNPQVSVNLKEVVSHLLTVDGEVKEPGQFPVRNQMTLISAIARAGGTTEFTKLDDVAVFRTVGSQRYVGLYNLQAIRRGAYRDPEVFADDVIVVGDSPERRKFKDLVGLGSILTTPLVGVLNAL